MTRKEAMKALEDYRGYILDEDIEALNMAIEALMHQETHETHDVHFDLVRCGECKWYKRFGCALDIEDESDFPSPNDFCSFGERAEIVKCKDCIHLGIAYPTLCRLPKGLTMVESGECFCSYGERRSDEADTDKPE